MYFYILCTLFDITATGVLNYKAESDNLYQRNQQRNWQVIQQLIQLRSQPILITHPIVQQFDLKYFYFGEIYKEVHKVWYTVFAVEYDQLYNKNNNHVAGLLEDFSFVPMLNKLSESVELTVPSLVTFGDDINICFYTPNNYPTCLEIKFDELENGHKN